MGGTVAMGAHGQYLGETGGGCGGNIGEPWEGDPCGTLGW